MDSYRVFLAILLSFFILVGYQFFFVKPAAQNQGAQQTAPSAESTAGKQAANTPAAAVSAEASKSSVVIDPQAKDIVVDTPLYTVVIKEQGGGFKSFVLKGFNTTLEKGSGLMQLVPEKDPARLPVLFSLDNGANSALPLFKADREKLLVAADNQSVQLVMKASLAEGIVLTRTLTFHGQSYLIENEYKVENTSGKPLQISPALSLNNEPFAHTSQSSQFLFAGATAYVNSELVETKEKKLTEGPVVLQGKVSWAGFVDNYFMTAVVPPAGSSQTVTQQGTAKEVRTVLSGGIQSLPAHGSQSFAYSLYFGPKKFKILQDSGFELAKAINYGWFDVLAKPMLWLLNFFHQFSGNYGVAIILLTVLIKLAFWPITQKGMTSMKNMQKLQPKIAKLREKYKDDPGKMNQEMMTLYKTYKVNPVGGCLPMLIQIPFFFALYRVLMAAIELRHAPFMLWINDLSAPDRLWIGFDLPYLHGIPILTLLMGGSMYLQQKMTPTSVDPAQARIMQFLPVVFTFMFINFASGLVLYWFVNNLLSILQQYMINRKTRSLNS